MHSNIGNWAITSKWHYRVRFPYCLKVSAIIQATHPIDRREKADATIIGDLAYTYDKAGLRIKSSGSLAQTDMPPADVLGVAYDANNRLTSWAGKAFSYDANGNLLNDGERSYTWNARNQLTGITGAATANFQYDAMNRRIGKTINGSTTGYLYDGANFVQEKDGTTSTAGVRAQLLTGGIDEILARYSAANSEHFHTDANNNVVQSTDAAQATSTSYRYDAYGKTTQTNVTAVSTNSQQYTGRENDGTGLYYYLARYHSPNCGRFISEDPIGWASWADQAGS
ncbi:MAG: RHS repeat-associated core domain-containing protein [Pseudomonadota bacterium]